MISTLERRALRIGVAGPVGSGKTALVESGGDNIAAAFSSELVDCWIYVLDVAAGDKMPRKGGPGITRSDLLLINKIDLAPHVGASLEVMARDTEAVRGSQPYIFTNLKDGSGLDQVLQWVQSHLETQEGRPRLQNGLLAPGTAIFSHHHHT